MLLHGFLAVVVQCLLHQVIVGIVVALPLVAVLVHVGELGIGVADTMAGSKLVEIVLDAVGVVVVLEHIVQPGIGVHHVWIVLPGHHFDFLHIIEEQRHVVVLAEQQQEEHLRFAVVGHGFCGGPKCFLHPELPDKLSG